MFTTDDNRPYIIKLPELLSSVECATLIERIEQLGPELATINTSSGTRIDQQIRNNDRVIFEDVALAAMLLERAKEKAPADIQGKTLVGANERFRCYRYQPGMRFAPHSDGSFQRDEHESSCYSFLVYLNDDFEGGQTTFFTKPKIAIEPEIGMGLLFQHPLIHEGSIVTSGVKYVARTDLMYRRIENISA
ncbi:MAG: 2OG-Fe(II) oxygenase [Blastopirellula sp.]|nr:MAG: 2OG-Fe(II) oxygenase [Blastopirellula sp.]